MSSRTARPDKPSQQRLERITGDAAEPIADRVKEIRAEVDRILGLDYDGFTRSVVLPQGQFDAFLKGEPKERRKILVALLNLTVYERMQQLANQRSSAAKTEAEFIKRQLETDFANATQEALEQKKQELKAAEACAKQAEAALAALAEASTHRAAGPLTPQGPGEPGQGPRGRNRPPRESPGDTRRSRPGEEDARPGARQAPGAEGCPRLRRSPPHDSRRRQAPRRPARQPAAGPHEGHEGSSPTNDETWTKPGRAVLQEEKSAPGSREGRSGRPRRGDRRSSREGGGAPRPRRPRDSPGPEARRPLSGLRASGEDGPEGKGPRPRRRRHR